METSHKKTVLLAIAIMFAAMLCVMPFMTTDAVADDIASGTCGTCSWVIDQDGVLTIGPSNGTSGSLANISSYNWPWYNYRTQVTSVVIEDGVAMSSGAYMFYEMSSCTEMDLEKLDTSSVTSMQSMFSGCSRLTSLDVSGWDTGSVTNMMCLFSNCSSLTSLDISGWNTSSVTSMQGMFSGCSSLAGLDVSGWNTGNVTDMYQMFNNCSSLTSLDVSGWNTGNVTNMSNMFSNCSSLTSLGVSGWDTGSVTNMGNMFMSCSSLSNLNISNWDTSKVTNMSQMFSTCSSLTNLDISSWNTSKVTSMSQMFYKCPNLSSITLGNNVTFKNNAYLPTPPTTTTTGKWIKDDESAGPYTPAELYTAYNANPTALTGIWVWQEIPTTYLLVFEADDGVIGTMANQKLVAAEDGVINSNTFALFDHTFDHWDASDGNEYEDGATIPANTYAIGDRITLTAVFAKNDHSVNVENGEFDITIHAGEVAYIPGLDAGTAYQVYEDIPSGWVLLTQTNTAGNIVPLETALAEFTNKYQPGTTTAALVATKLIDGTPAAAGSYSFELLQDDTVLQTIANGASGFVQFDALSFTAPGEYTYTIREVMGSNDTVVYDTHEEDVTVTVSDDGLGNLTAAVQYDADGAVFQNYTKPGALILAKHGIGVTEQNADEEFAFRVTFRRTNGLPLEDDDIRWYVTKQPEP